MTKSFDKSRCKEISECKYGIKKCDWNITITNECINIYQLVFLALFEDTFMTEALCQRVSAEVWKLFLILSCILNFSFDCISNKLCTHWCCIKCCEHQHEGLESQIKNPYLTEFRRIEKGIDRTYEILIDLPKPRKMTLYNLQLNFILFLCRPWVFKAETEFCEIELWFINDRFLRKLQLI